MNRNKRPQSPKRINRHASSIMDKDRRRSGPIMPSARYNRATDNRWGV